MLQLYACSLGCANRAANCSGVGVTGGAGTPCLRRPALPRGHPTPLPASGTGPEIAACLLGEPSPRAFSSSLPAILQRRTACVAAGHSHPGTSPPSRHPISRRSAASPPRKGPLSASGPCYPHCSSCEIRVRHMAIRPCRAWLATYTAKATVPRMKRLVSIRRRMAHLPCADITGVVPACSVRSNSRASASPFAQSGSPRLPAHCTESAVPCRLLHRLQPSEPTTCMAADRPS